MNLHRSDIIILILANVVVAGSFLWWLTRRTPRLRMGLVVLLVALKLAAAVPGSWTESVWNATFTPGSTIRSSCNTSASCCRAAWPAN